MCAIYIVFSSSTLAYENLKGKIAGEAEVLPVFAVNMFLVTL